MANKGVVQFFVDFIGDGASNTWAVAVATGPFALLNPSSGYDISSTFSLASTIPTGIINLACTGGLGVTAVIALGIITFTFTGGPPANGTQYSITGTFEF
jgi:hypothetical protein